MDFGHERASGIDDAQLPFLRLCADTRRHAVSAENKHGTDRNFLDRFHEDCATAPQLIYHVAVMYDFMVNVDGAAVSFEREFDDIRCSDYSSAESSRPNTYQSLAPIRSALNVR